MAVQEGGLGCAFASFRLLDQQGDMGEAIMKFPTCGPTVDLLRGCVRPFANSSECYSPRRRMT